jgi:hypothetical protein
MNKKSAGGQLSRTGSQIGSADNKSSHAGVAESKGSKAVSDSKALSKAERKDGSYHAEAKQVSPRVQSKPTPLVTSNAAAAADDMLKEVKEKHKQALRSLQNIMDSDKMKKVKPIEDRLMLKKLQLADRKKAADSANSDIDAATEQRLIAALEDEIGEIQTEIEEAQENAERNKEGLVPFQFPFSSLRCWFIASICV